MASIDQLRFFASSMPLLVSCALAACMSGTARAECTVQDQEPDTVEEVRIDAPAFGDEQRAQLEQLLQGLVEAGDFPSVSIAVSRGDGVVFAGASGLRDVETTQPATPDTIYQIASVSKIVTATLLFTLVEQGAVSLDDSVVEFLPKGTRIGTQTDWGERITLRHLVTHTSGLPGGGHPSPVHSRDGSYKTFQPETLYEQLKRTELLAKPGEKREYSNIGFGLLGHVLELATDTEFESLARARLLEPLGMTSTRLFDRHAPYFGGVATGYADGEGEEPVAPTSLLRRMPGSGGFVSTASDLARLACLHAGGLDESARVLTRAACAEMVSAGIGWSFTRLPDSDALLPKKNGGRAGVGAYLLVAPGTTVGVAVLVNRTYPRPPERSVGSVAREALRIALHAH